MKKRICAGLLLVLSFICSGQTIVQNNKMGKDYGKVSVAIQSATDSMALSYASVYLTGAKDTLLTNFTLSNLEGIAILENVYYGNYFLHIDLLGYERVTEKITIEDSEVNRGIIFLKEETQWLDEATISNTISPAVIKGDTTAFLASFYSVGQNSSLEDLVKQLPGMVVTDNGLSFNGKPVSYITIEGRVFFFEDTSVALKNLPASIVNKINVIKQMSETDTKVLPEKRIIDIELKDEYKKGVFGSVMTAVGATASRSKDDELIDNRGLLYYANGIVSGFEEKRQATLIANTWNAPMENAQSKRQYSSENQGLQRPSWVGINLNDQSTPAFDGNFAIHYSRKQFDLRENGTSTTLLNRDSILTTEKLKELDDTHLVKLQGEAKSKFGKLIHISYMPDFSFHYSKKKSEELLARLHDDDSTPDTLSTSNTTITNEQKSFSHLSKLRISANNLGKKHRNLIIYSSSGFSAGVQQKKQTSEIVENSSLDTNIIDYQIKTYSFQHYSIVKYTEPVLKSLHFAATSELNIDLFNTDQNAVQRSYNTNNLSFSSKQNKVNLKNTFSLRYYLGDWVIEGGVQTQNALNRSKDPHNQNLHDIKENVFRVSPVANIAYDGDHVNFTIGYGRYVVTPSNIETQANIDKTSPTDVKIGNVGLKQGAVQGAECEISYFHPKKLIAFNCDINVKSILRKTIPVVWFDEDNTRYRFYVNANKAINNYSASFNVTLPVSSSKRLFILLSESIRIHDSVAYQSSFPLSVDGDYYPSYYRIITHVCDDNYLSEVTSSHISNRFSLGIKWQGNKVTAQLTPSYSYTMVSYSNQIDKQTIIEAELYGSLFWKLPKGFELSACVQGEKTKGRGQGYDSNYITGNLGLSKNLGAFEILLQINDIMNSNAQTQYLNYADGFSFSRQNRLGRNCFISVRWLFGKANKDRQRIAKNAISDF